MPRATKETDAQREAREAKELAVRNARLAEIHKRHEVLAQQIEDIKAEDETLKAEAAELLKNELGTHEHDGGAVQLQPNRRWDDDTAREVIGAISPDILKAITIETLDSKKAKELLPPATYKKCMKDGARPKVIFK